MVPTHGPTLTGAIDHFATIGGGCADWCEGEDRLIAMGEQHRKATLLRWLSSAGGDQAIQGAGQRPSGVVVDGWHATKGVGPWPNGLTTLEHLEGVVPFTVEADLLCGVLALIGFALFRRKEAEPIEPQAHGDIALALAKDAWPLQHGFGVVMPAQAAVGINRVGWGGSGDCQQADCRCAKADRSHRVDAWSRVTR